MQSNEQIIRDFYEAFSKRDAAGMVACYAPDVVFSDPVFVGLRGAEARAMWRMLCERGKDLRVEYRDVSADEGTGRAHWDAHYTFSQTGRPVINRIDASFRFANGKIIEHTDTFDLWSWTRQALGVSGVLLGWGPIRGPLRSKARKGLLDYMAKHPE
jgi:ketosteroid isomerase-like protein